MPSMTMRCCGPPRPWQIQTRTRIKKEAPPIARLGWLIVVALFSGTALWPVRRTLLRSSDIDSTATLFSVGSSHAPSRPQQHDPHRLNVVAVRTTTPTAATNSTSSSTTDADAIPHLPHSIHNKPDELDELLQSLDIHPRPFRLWNNHTLPLPCEPVDQDWNSNARQKVGTTKGFLFVKPLKTGSSTAASVTLRIATLVHRLRHSNDNGNSNDSAATAPICDNRVQHSQTRNMHYDVRNKSNSVLWSVVRHPTSRAMSQYFHFCVSRRNCSTADEAIETYLSDPRNVGSQVNFLSLQHVAKRDDRTNAIRDILHHYDFVAVMERMDESLVALQMILNLDVSAILHIK